MKTNQGYINEFSMYDDVIEYLEECSTDVTFAIARYKNRKREEELKSFFEGAVSNIDLLFESETENKDEKNNKNGENSKNKGVLERIGTAIIDIVKKLQELLGKVKDAIFGTSKDLQSDAEIVNKMLIEHPELKTQVVRGLNEEWFTYRDIATYQKDIVGLYNMLEKNAIDHQTFKEKMDAAANKFKDSAKPILAASATVVALLKIFPSVVKGCSDCRDTLQKMTDGANSLKKGIEDSYVNRDLNVLQSVFNELTKAIGLQTEECKRRVEGAGKLHQWTSSFCNSAVGRFLKVDDYNREERHKKARDKYDDKKYREKLAQTKEQNRNKERADDIKRRVDNETYDPFEVKVK